MLDLRGNAGQKQDFRDAHGERERSIDHNDHEQRPPPQSAELIADAASSCLLHTSLPSASLGFDIEDRVRCSRLGYTEGAAATD